MSTEPRWLFVGASPEGRPFQMGGLDVWEHEWSDTREKARVEEPRERRGLTFGIYEIRSGDHVVRFAAGELSSGVWGFYVRRQG